MKVPASLMGVWDGLVNWFSTIHWNRTQAVINGGMYYCLTESDHDRIRELLKSNYYIILTRRKAHLTTYLIAIASAIVDHKLSHYTHALMNVEGDLEGHLGYKLIEATMCGVHYSTFMEVFDCDSVVLLHPKGVSPEEWTEVMDAVKTELGKQYDTLFDIISDQNVSCVEMVYWGLKTLPDYETRFPKLVALIEERKNNLTPQMLYDTGELEITLEVRR
jgi:RNAse (barnase) inhibitor barstar